MENAGMLYMLLIGAIAVAFYLQIEFLYFALIAVLILLMLADRQTPSRQYEPQPMPENEIPAGPVVIQQAHSSQAHDFIDGLVTSLVQQSRSDVAEEERFAKLNKNLKKELGGLRDEVSDLRKQLDDKKNK